jgi:serine/threonine-protein kinase
MQGMDPDPKRRQASAGALVRDLEAALPSVGTARPPTIASTEPMTPVAQERHAPPPLSRSPDTEPTQRRGWLLPALVCIGALLLGGAWLAFSGGEGDSGKRTERSKQAADHKQAGGSPTKSAAATPTTPTTDTAAPPAEAVPSTSASEPGTAGSQLNEEGYSLIQQGRHVEAIPVLRRAVASFPQGTTDLNFAYALFNLGHALRMAGHPEEAIPILERRLEIPNQTQTVQSELEAARAAAGE